MRMCLQPSKAWTDLERVVWRILLKIVVLRNFSRHLTPDSRVCQRCVVMSVPSHGRKGGVAKVKTASQLPATYASRESEALACPYSCHIVWTIAATSKQEERRIRQGTLNFLETARVP